MLHLLSRLLVAAALVALPLSFGAPTDAAAATPICVALVVDFADIGGGVSTSCASVPGGSTGYDVLRAGGHTFTICSNGVLGTIDGKPDNGCAVKDSSHYWSYWHRAPGGSGWTYSDQGAGSYRPANRSTEGWVWQNGSSRQPAAVPYSRICAATASPSPRPRPDASTTSPPTTGHRSSTSPYRAQRTSAPPAGRPVPSDGAATPTAPRHPTRRPTTSPPAGSPRPAEHESPTPTVLGDDRSAADGSGPPWGLLSGGAAVLALGAAAGWRFRRDGPET